MSPATKKIKILLVEDEPLIVEMYKTRLEKEGFEIFCEDQGSKVLELLPNFKPDLILLDIILPELDGFSLLEEIKKQPQYQKTPVFLLTNLGQDSDLKRGQELGAQGYLVKSKFTPSDVVNKIKETLKLT